MGCDSCVNENEKIFNALERAELTKVENIFYASKNITNFGQDCYVDEGQA